MKIPQLIFLAGVPASGKTFFGQWLESNHDYIHIDPEVDSRLADLNLHEAWNDSFATGECGLFAARALALGSPVVFNWGFKPEHLHIAAAVKRTGFNSWWFDAPVQKARSAFIARGDGKDLRVFDLQIAKIQQKYAQIRAVFEPNILTTFDASGRRITPDEIWTRMQSAA